MPPLVRSQQILSERPLGWSRLVRQLGRQRCLDRRPRQPGGQHRQRVAQVDHLLETGAEEIVCGHRRGSPISQELASIGLNVGRSNHRKSPESRYETTGCEFRRADSFKSERQIVPAAAQTSTSAGWYFSSLPRKFCDFVPENFSSDDNFGDCLVIFL